MPLVQFINFHSEKFYTYASTNMDTTNILRFLTMFAHNFI